MNDTGITNQIDRITKNIQDSYTAAAELGANMPAEQNSDNLPAALQSVGSSIVRVTAQEFTEEQQAQARGNIGAASADAIGDIETAVDEILAAQSIYIGALDEVIALQNSYIDGGESI